MGGCKASLTSAVGSAGRIITVIHVFKPRVYPSDLLFCHFRHSKFRSAPLGSKRGKHIPRATMPRPCLPLPLPPTERRATYAHGAPLVTARGFGSVRSGRVRFGSVGFAGRGSVGRVVMRMTPPNATTARAGRVGFGWSGRGSRVGSHQTRRAGSAGRSGRFGSLATQRTARHYSQDRETARAGFGSGRSVAFGRSVESVHTRTRQRRRAGRFGGSGRVTTRHPTPPTARGSVHDGAMWLATYPARVGSISVDPSPRATPTSACLP